MTMSLRSPASSPALSHSSSAPFDVADEEAAVGKSPPSKGLHPVFHIAYICPSNPPLCLLTIRLILDRTWIFFSNITILFNKWILDNAGFRKHPLCIVALQQPLTIPCLARISYATTSHRRRVRC